MLSGAAYVEKTEKGIKELVKVLNVTNQFFLLLKTVY